MPAGLPLAEAVTQATVAFNALEPVAVPQHRQRMRLLLNTPALLAVSELRSAAWRGVVPQFAADRLHLSVDGLLPTLLGRIALAIALSANELWLPEDSAQLGKLVREADACVTWQAGHP